MFERMEIADKFYEGEIPSKITIRAEADRASHGRKRKGVEAASPTNPKKGRAGKRKKNHSGHPSDQPTGDKTCLVHGLGHSKAECKLLKE